MRSADKFMFARQCNTCKCGINAGYVYRDGEGYYCESCVGGFMRSVTPAEVSEKSTDDELMQKMYDDDELHFTDWHPYHDAQDEWYESSHSDGREALKISKQ